MRKKISKKWLGLIVLIVLFLLNATLLDKGFCYSEMTFLSKRQMLDRSIFGSNADNLDRSEKEAILKKRHFDNYPNNCVFTKHAPIGLTPFDGVMHSLFGKKIFGVECVSSRDAAETDNSQYYFSNSGIASCGVRSSDSSGEGISEKLFNAVIRNNTKFWEEQKP